MSGSNSAAQVLRHRIQNLETELKDLKKQLLETEAEEAPHSSVDPAGEWTWPLASEEYQRYGRQMIMPEIGLQGRLP